MPLASYRSYVGIATDKLNGTVTSAMSASATSLPVQNLTSAASTALAAAGSTYTAIIIDGPLTESTALTGNLTGGAVACTSTTNAHSANAYVVFQLTASIGPTAYLPLEKFTPVDTYAQLYEKTFRGSNVDTVGAVAGLRTSAFDLSGPVFADTYPYILGGLFGAEDKAGSSPYTHAFSVLNQGTYQPTAYILYYYNGYNCRIFAGGKFTESVLTLDPKALMTHSSKFISRASGVVTTPTTAFSGILPTTGWSSTTTIGGTATLSCLTGEVTFSRMNPEGVPTLQGIQDPYAVWVGQMSVKGKFDAVKEDDTLLADYFNESQPSLKWTALTGSGASQTGITVQSTKANIETAATDSNAKAYPMESFTYEAIANSTDATTAGAGLSPVKVTVTNAVNSATTFV